MGGSVPPLGTAKGSSSPSCPFCFSQLLVLVWFNCWVRWTYDLGGFKLITEAAAVRLLPATYVEFLTFVR